MISSFIEVTTKWKDRYDACRCKSLENKRDNAHVEEVVLFSQHIRIKSSLQICCEYVQALDPRMIESSHLMAKL